MPGKDEPSVSWKTYVDSQVEASRHERDLIRQFTDKSQDRLAETTDRRFDALGEWRESLMDQMANMPSKGEVSAQIQNVVTLVQTLNGRVSEFMQSQEIKSSGYMTQEQFQAYEKTRVSDQRDSRRALGAALTGIGIALLGWIITIVLTLLSSKGG